MNGPATEVENSVQEASNQLLALQAALRKAKTVRVLGTVVAFAIAGLYAILFVTLITRGLNLERIREAAQKELGDPAFRGELEAALNRVVKDVRPAYLKEIEEKAKALQSELAPEIKTQLGELALDVGGEYVTALRKTVTEVGLVGEFSKVMSSVAKEAGPLYIQEVHRIAPEVFSAVKEARTKLMEDLAESMQTWLNDAIADSLQRNKKYMEVTIPLTPEGVEEKLGDVVLAVTGALTNVVKQRTDKWKADLDAIQAMLNEIPDATEKDPDRLVDEIGKVSLNLVKLSIDDYKGHLE